MSATLALGALKLGGAYMQYRNQIKKDKDMQRHLKNKMKTGAYSTAQESQIVGGVAKTASNVAQETKSNVQGNLIAGGMGNSIAGVSAKRQIDQDSMEKVTDTREAIEFSEAETKYKARDEYANFKSEESRRETDALNSLIGAGTDVASGMITGTGDFEAPGTGWGEYKNVTTKLATGDKRLIEINGVMQEAVWDGTRMIPVGSKV